MTRQEEFQAKIDRISAYLEHAGADGVALSRADHFAWLTCGGSSYVNTAAECGVATVFVMGGKALVITNRIEEKRLVDEELCGLPVEIDALPWQKERGAHVMSRISSRNVLTDSPLAGLPALPADFERLMYELTPPEIERYRQTGALTGQALQQACMDIKIGMTEHTIAGILAGKCFDAGVLAPVILVAADERLKNYRHPIPTDKKVEKTVMVVVCGKKHGLIASCTRIVNFGAVDADLARRHEVCARVDTAYNTLTRPGAALEDVFSGAKKVYLDNGYDGEWNLHHQGGPTGYRSRYFLVNEHCSEKAAANTAYAWNPSITGTKVEDTLLVLPDGNEFITAAPGWPMIETVRDDKVLKRPDILCV